MATCAGPRSAAAVPPRDAARGRRRHGACDRDRGRGGRRHAGLCRALRPRGVRRGAGAGRAALDRRAARSMPARPRSPTRSRCMRRRRSRSRSTGPTPSASTAGWSAACGWNGRSAPTRTSRAPWLVFGAMIRTVALGEDEPGLRPLSSALEDEGFDGLGSGRLVESFARHLMSAIDAWQERASARSRRTIWRGCRPSSGTCGRRHRRERRSAGAAHGRGRAGAAFARQRAVARCRGSIPTTGGPRT